MICRRCLLRLSHSRPLSIFSITTQSHSISQTPWSPSRTLHTSPIAKSATTSKATVQSPPTAQTSTPNRSPPAATSTGSDAQPFSTPLQPGPKTPGSDLKPLSAETDEEALRVVESRSAVAAGTPLKGLNYFKNKTDPVAMEDHEYPDWLWSILEQPRMVAAEDSSKEVVDPKLFSKSRHARRKANKRAKLNASTNATREITIPLHHQAVDLPAGLTPLQRSEARQAGNDSEIHEHATEAAGARKDLTRSMRAQRRQDIKRSNFLKGVS